MDALGIAFLTVGIGLVLSSYGYTYLAQRDSSKKTDSVDQRHIKRMEVAEENWAKRADDMRRSRDSQISELRADTTLAISNLTVSLYEHRLHSATTFATIKSVESIEENLSTQISKVETKLEGKLDRLTEMVKNGGRG